MKNIKKEDMLTVISTVITGLIVLLIQNFNITKASLFFEYLIHNLPFFVLLYFVVKNQKKIRVLGENTEKQLDSIKKTENEQNNYIENFKKQIFEQNEYLTSKVSELQSKLEALNKEINYRTDILHEKINCNFNTLQEKINNNSDVLKDVINNNSNILKEAINNNSVVLDDLLDKKSNSVFINDNFEVEETRAMLR